MTTRLYKKSRCQCLDADTRDEIVIWYPRSYKAVKTVCLKCNKVVRITSINHLNKYK